MIVKAIKERCTSEILDLKVCDPAMGSGAFLVQACRYLGEKLVDAWLHEEASGKAITIDGEAINPNGIAEPMPSQLDERLTIARRLIAERCLYGVDINPLAVELAKLSIWLVTLAKGRPFGFLDHNLRTGDSLLGIHRMEQLTQLRMHIGSGRLSQLRFFEQNFVVAVNEALEIRKRLRATTIRDIEDVEVMARFDRVARQKLESVELIADALIGETLQCNGNSKGFGTAMDTFSTMVFDYLNGNQMVGNQIAHQTIVGLSVDLAEGKAPRKPFHWALEFPEVFQIGGFNGIIGNPPFLGGKRISTVQGSLYNTYLASIHPPASKNTDLVAHFFRRSFDLLNYGGSLGLLAVNTIAEGDTRQGGLEWMTRNGATIYAAYPSEPWPGKAAVVTSRVHIYKGDWNGLRILSGTSVQFISAFLSNQEEWSLKRLKTNEGKAFQGSIVLGMGFVLSQDEARWMLEADPRNAEVIFPYLNGDDLNSDPVQRASRWVINFWDWPEEKAATYLLPYNWIKQHVFPERLEKSKEKSYKNIMSMWWQHWNVRPGLYHSIGRGKQFYQWKPSKTSQPFYRVLAITRVSKTLAFSFVNPSYVFSDATVVFALQEAAYFSILQSNIHGVFAWQHSSKLKNDLRYSPTDAFETFPLPETHVISSDTSLQTLGETYHKLRTEIMRQNGIGLTRLYRRFHDPNETDQSILELRSLHVLIDEAVTHSYGWASLSLDHGFHEVPYLPENDRIRFTISESTRTEILRRLSEINRRNYNEEIRIEPHGRILSPDNIPKQQIKRISLESDFQSLFDECNAGSGVEK